MNPVVKPLDPSDIPTVTQWINDPATSGPLFVATPVSERELARGQLRICDDRELELDAARFFGVHWQEQLVGFYIDYGWDFASDTMRELDLALPGEHPRTPRFLIDSFAVMVHLEFSTLGARYIRAAMVARDAKKRDRLFAQVGAIYEGDLPATRPGTDERVNRRIYGVDPDRFYASPAGVRLFS